MLGRLDLFDETSKVSAPVSKANPDALASLKPFRMRAGKKKVMMGERRRGTHSLDLEGSDGLHLSRNIVVLGFECAEDLLSLGDDVLVLQDSSVVLEVDLRLRVLELRVRETSVGSTLSKGGESRDGLYRSGAAGPGE